MNSTISWMPKLILLACFVLFALASGCGGDANVADVSGTVTLGGQPLPQALVTLTPQDGQSPSMGMTDDNGRYTLHYTRDLSGAEIGEHLVTITTYSSGDADAEPPQAASPEKVPAKYNVRSVLTADVQPGDNTIDFELEAGGEITTPDEVPADS